MRGEWYLPARDSDGFVYVREQGQGRPVLVVHGGPGAEHGYLVGALDFLAEERRVVWFDQRGSLRSRFPIERVTLAGVVDDVLALVAEVGPCDVVAHSFGAIVLGEALRADVTGIGRVVLVNPAPLSATLAALRQPATPRPEVEAELARLGLDRGDLPAREATWAWRVRFAGQNIHRVDRWDQMAGGWAFYDQAASDAISRGLPSDFNLVPALLSHAPGAVIVAGAEDHNAVALHHLADAGLDVRPIPAAGHCPWIDEPDAFRALVRTALGGP